EVQGAIRVSWTKEDSHIVLRVKDNGPGIAPEHHDRLFERFYRIDRGRSRDSGGTGLGLAIAKHIVVNHGGTIRVESLWGQGAEFICEFPEHRPSWRNLDYDKLKNP
ncbi:MAG: ATP-binding protein, partial [Bdellovibrio sp.]